MKEYEAKTNVTPRILWTFQVPTRDLKLIRKALEQFGGNGSVLATKITNQLNAARKELVASIDASLTVEKD